MGNRTEGIDWTDEIGRSLRRLWNEGHSAAEIGRRLGVSKNAIIGKVYRLSLSSRPSPIRKDGVRTPRPTRRPPVPRLADIMPMTATVMVPATTPPQRTPTPRHQPAPAHRIPTPAIEAAVSNKPCCWPIGEPGTRDFYFCDAPALVGKPYCNEHAHITYRRVRRRDEDDRLAAAD